MKTKYIQYIYTYIDSVFILTRVKINQLQYFMTRSETTSIKNRISYLNNEITSDKYKTILYKHYKDNIKKLYIIDILYTHNSCATDILYKLYEGADFTEITMELNNLKNIININLEKICKMFDASVITINNEIYEDNLE